MRGKRGTEGAAGVGPGDGGREVGAAGCLARPHLGEGGNVEFIPLVLCREAWAEERGRVAGSRLGGRGLRNQTATQSLGAESHTSASWLMDEGAGRYQPRGSAALHQMRCLVLRQAAEGARLADSSAAAWVTRWWWWWVPRGNSGGSAEAGAHCWE